MIWERQCVHLQLRAWPKGADPSTGVQFLSNSWVHDAAPDRIFFTGAPTLPSQTPSGLQALRQEELQNLRVCAQLMRSVSELS